MPPAALISFTASFTPLSKLVPEVAPVPDSSTRPAIFNGCWASGGCAKASAQRAAANTPVLFMVMLLHLVWGRAARVFRTVPAPPDSRRSGGGLQGFL